MTRRLSGLLFAVVTGFTATVVAAASSLLVDGVDAKRWTWALAGVVVAVTAGAWRGRRD